MFFINLAKKLDAFNECISHLSSWLIFMLVILVAGNVFARYFFAISSVGMQELEWHLLAAIAVFGSVYTLQQGEHVRVDLFYHRYSKEVKRWMDLMIPLVIIIPFSVFMIYLTSDFVFRSLEIMEVSPDPGGLKYRYLVKALLPVGFLLIALQGLALFLMALTNTKQGR